MSNPRAIVFKIPPQWARRAFAAVDALNSRPRPETPEGRPWRPADIYRRAIEAGMPIVLAELAPESGGEGV